MSNFCWNWSKDHFGTSLAYFISHAVSCNNYAFTVFTDDIASAEQALVAFSNFRLLRSAAPRISSPIPRADGTMVSDKLQKLHCWKEYYSDLLNRPPAPPSIELFQAAADTVPDPSIDCSPPSEQQSGFTPGRSTMDRIATLNLLHQTRREFNLKATFDSVDRNAECPLATSFQSFHPRFSFCLVVSESMVTTQSGSQFWVE